MTDFVMQIGCDWSRSIIYNDSNNTPINLTGYTAKMQVRATNGSHDAIKILDLSSPSNGITIDGVLGKITINVTHQQLTEPTLKLGGITTAPALLTESNVLSGVGKIGFYQLLLTAPSGAVSELLSGKVCFVPAVCR